MLRVLFCCFLAGEFVGAAVHAPWLGFPVGCVVLGFWCVARVNGDVAPTRCKDCGKRVKLGAKACHHCGRRQVREGV